jgi:hypothetical protein
LKFIFSQEQSTIAALEEFKRRTYEAQVGAVKEAADLAVKEGQENVTSAGFSKSRQVKSKFYPNVGSDPAALVYFAMPFVHVFERGANISGHPLLWLPIEQNLPSGITSPKQYGKKLISVNVAGKPPLLFDARNRLLGPLFVGIKTVTIRKRLDLKRIFFSAAAQVLEFFEQRIKD